MGKIPTKSQIDNSSEVRKEFKTRSHLREIRESRGWSQVQLAGRVATSPQIISKAEHGKILQLRVSMLIRIATALDLGVSDLWPIFGPRLTQHTKKKSQLNPIPKGMSGTEKRPLLPLTEPTDDVLKTEARKFS